MALTSSNSGTIPTRAYVRHDMTFSVPVVARGYELDTLDHLNLAVYLQYTERAR
ncbi:hypothetical protein [Nocardia australiensis]|uniref:hypothetical protein n=1 Tax=Nocardia australiensis TaxID=2887191 RepID=UPI001D1404D4|nr:hypothetical protein [Nocardia australiensis]